MDNKAQEIVIKRDKYSTHIFGLFEEEAAYKQDRTLIADIANGVIRGHSPISLVGKSPIEISRLINFLLEVKKQQMEVNNG